MRRPVGDQGGGGKAELLERLVGQLGHEGADARGGRATMPAARAGPLRGAWRASASLRGVGRGAKLSRRRWPCAGVLSQELFRGSRCQASDERSRTPTIEEIDSRRARETTVTLWRESNCRSGRPARTRVDALLAWYDAERRDLPWRVAPGEEADPYRVWLSEIMLQQTTVKAVIPFYQRFLHRWPTVGDWRQRRSTTCSRLGGARLLRARAQSAQVREAVAARARRHSFRRPRLNCRSCRASGRTRRRRSQRSPSASRRRRSTATSSAWWRGCSR